MYYKTSGFASYLEMEPPLNISIVISAVICMVYRDDNTEEKRKWLLNKQLILL